MKKKSGMSLIVILGIIVLLMIPNTIITAETGSIELENNTILSFCYINDNKLLLSFKLQEVVESPVMTDNCYFTKLEISNSGFIGDLGKPQLPVVTCLIAVPTLDVSLNVVDVKIAESSWVGKIYPAQKAQIDSEKVENNECVIDESFYQQDLLYPGKLSEIVYDGNIRDISFVKIEFYPVQYNPKEEIATIYDEITIKLSWDEDKIVKVKSDFKDYLFFGYYDNVFLNWKEFINRNIIIESQISDSLIKESGCDYLIITHPDFYSEIIELAKWKQSKGFRTKVVNTTETGNNSSQIRQYIQNMYDTGIPRLSYVLLVGDTEYVPTNYENTVASDLWYATVDGSDYYPDLFIGRIPVDTAQETDIIVHKILTYEQNPPTINGFYENFAVAAQFWDAENNGYETRRFVRTSEEIRDYLLILDYTGERVYVTEPNINPTHYNNGVFGNGEPLPPELLRPTFPWDGDTDDIINSIEQGIFILNHRDHGSEEGWIHPWFDISDIESLTNDNLYPVVLSINCNTGKFDYNDCFCEEFIKKENGGAIGIFGASNISYSGYNDYLCRGFYDAIWPDFDQDIGGDTPTYGLGAILNYAKPYMVNTWGDPWGHERLTFELFHCFGDPSLEIWTTIPKDLNVTHLDTISFRSMPFTVHVESAEGTNINNSSVCIWKDNDLFLTDYTNTVGNATFNITTSTGGIMKITVTKHDFRPYQGETVILPMSNLRCNGNLKWTKVIPGEPINDSFTVENIGDSDSLLDWEIESYPDWGTWTFTPSNGYDLLPKNPLIVGVMVIAPDEPEKTFTGEVKIVNSENPYDYCILNVSLATPINQQNYSNTILQRIFERFPNAFRILRQLLDL